MAVKLTCQQCGGPMKKTTLSSGNCSGLVVGLLVIAAGLLITILLWWTIIGAIIGIALMFGGLLMGGKKQKVWRCTKCRSIVPRG